MFSKKAAPEQTPLAPSRAIIQGRATPANAPFSMLGSDLAVRGDVSAAHDVHIDGRIEGNVTCTALVLGEGGTIIGAVSAASARIAGTVHGAITVADLIIQRSARIEGDVTYATLAIEPGARVEGRFVPRSDETTTPEIAPAVAY